MARLQLRGDDVPRRSERPRFEIWEAGSTIHAEANPVRLRLLHLLEQRPRRLGELVQATRKAKSTLSAVHLRPLLRAALVAERTDPRDGRAKIWRLQGRRLGRSDVAVPQLRAAVLRYAEAAAAAPTTSLLGVLEPQALLESGARPEYVDAVGDRLGRALGRNLSSRLEDAVRELNAVLKPAGLGEVRWEAGTLRVSPMPARRRAFVERLARAALDGRRPPRTLRTTTI